MVEKEELLEPGERIERLGNGMGAIVSQNVTFGMDAVLLAHWSARIPTRHACDLGTGCGIIPLLLARNGVKCPVDGFEIQQQAADMARRAMVLNGLERNHIYCADIRQISVKFARSYDLAVCNPPYYPVGTVRKGSDSSRAIARCEICCTLEDAVKAASVFLREGGSFCLCHRPARLADVAGLMRSCGLEPKRLRVVQQNRLKSPWLLLAQGVKGARPGLEVEPAFICERDGKISREMREVYGDYSQ